MRHRVRALLTAIVPIVLGTACEYEMTGPTALAPVDFSSSTLGYVSGAEAAQQTVAGSTPCEFDQEIYIGRVYDEGEYWSTANQVLDDGTIVIDLQGSDIIGITCGSPTLVGAPAGIDLVDLIDYGFHDWALTWDPDVFTTEPGNITRFGISLLGDFGSDAQDYAEVELSRAQLDCRDRIDWPNMAVSNVSHSNGSSEQPLTEARASRCSGIGIYTGPPMWN